MQWTIECCLSGWSRGFQPGVRGPLVVRDGIAGGPRHEPMLISSPLTFFIFIKYLGPSTYLCLNSQVALPKILMQTHIQRRNYTDKYYRQNMCARGGGVAAVTNMKKNGTVKCFGNHWHISGPRITFWSEWWSLGQNQLKTP